MFDVLLRWLLSLNPLLVWLGVGLIWLGPVLLAAGAWDRWGRGR